MKIRGLCVVKDEDDVIEETLVDATRWCDRIFVLDNQSSDDTWTKVLALSERHPEVVAVGRDARPFFDGIRADIFNRYADEARPGDWWCRLDADELFVDDPRAFLAAVDEESFSVWTASLSYYFTDVDAARYREDPVAWERTPVVERCRYYLNHWSEPRLFRHVPGLRWQAGHGGFPRVLWRRPAARERILVRHFAYRSPRQIQRRLEARRGLSAFAHEAGDGWAEAVADIRTAGAFRAPAATTREARWTDRVVPAAALDYDAHDGRFVINRDLMPGPPTPITQLEQLRSEVRGLRQRAIGRVRRRSA